MDVSVLLRGLALGAGLWLLPGIAAAQPAAPNTPPPDQPKETIKPQTATSGATEVAKGGFVTTAAPKDDDPKEANDVNIGLGGLFSAGNARTVAITSFVKSRFRRDEHQFSGAGVANFARAGKKGEAVDTT